MRPPEAAVGSVRWCRRENCTAIRTESVDTDGGASDRTEILSPLVDIINARRSHRNPVRDIGATAQALSALVKAPREGAPKPTQQQLAFIGEQLTAYADGGLQGSDQAALDAALAELITIRKALQPTPTPTPTPPAPPPPDEGLGGGDGEPDSQSGL
jgi:hypothetical protein